MDRDLKHARISVVIHAAIAVSMGYFSTWLMNSLYAGVAGIVVLVAIGYPLERLAGNRGLKWWFANGIFIYLFFWLVSWTYFFNAGI